tara:strand:- start:1797 stop:4361 length:2565 start_codon:yes stop_codon:yes gene_type:complete
MNKIQIIKKRNIIISTILSSSLLIGLFFAATNIASADSFNVGNNIETITTLKSTTGNKEGSGLEIISVPKITFQIADPYIITANNNAISGILLRNSTGIFNNPIEANNNPTGISVWQSIAVFNGSLTVNDKNVVNNNVTKLGMYIGESKVTFNDSIKLNNTLISGLSVTSKDSPNEVTFNKEVTGFGNKKYGFVLINSNTLFNGDVTFDKPKENNFIMGGKTTFNGNVTTNEIKLTRGIDSQSHPTLIFGNGTNDIVISTLITPCQGNIGNEEINVEKSSNIGDIIFNGGVTINDDIGTKEHFIKNIQFTSTVPEKVVHLNSNIYSGTLSLGELTFKPANNITLASRSNKPVTLNNSVLDLGTNTLIVSGGLKNDGDIITINTVFDGKNAGHIELIDGELNLGKSNLVFNIKDSPNTPIPKAGETREVQIFDTNQISFTPNQTKTPEIKWDNKYVKWSFDLKKGALSQVSVEKPEKILIESIDSAQRSNAEIILNSGGELGEELINIAANEGEAAAAETISRLQPDVLALSTAPINMAIQDATQVISVRAEKLSLQTLKPNNVSGIGAGEEVNKYGVWISPFYGISTQKLRNKTPGYKSTYSGGVIGFDHLINDRTAIGLAFSAIRTNIKHKNTNDGDKTTANSYILSGYGTYELTPEWFIQSVASVGQSSIKNKELRKELGRTSIAKASYNSTYWGTEILTGYNKTFSEKLIFTPLFGIEYNRLNGINYTEKGTNLQNFTVKRKNINKLETILGLRVTTLYTLENGISIVPELHGNVRYNMFNNKVNIDIKQNGVNSTSLIPTSTKQVRAVYNAGIGLNICAGEQLDYAIGYDLRLADKYIGHQGTFKVRLNF